MFEASCKACKLEALEPNSLPTCLVSPSAKVPPNALFYQCIKGLLLLAARWHVNNKHSLSKLVSIRNTLLIDLKCAADNVRIHKD